VGTANTIESIRHLIITEFSWPGDGRQLSNDYPLLENAVIDSLGVHQLVTFLEATYGIEIDDEDLVPENFETLATIADMVERKERAQV
jgi:acyl carrier protein